MYVVFSPTEDFGPRRRTADSSNVREKPYSNWHGSRTLVAHFLLRVYLWRQCSEKPARKQTTHFQHSRVILAFFNYTLISESLVDSVFEEISLAELFHVVKCSRNHTKSHVNNA